MTHDFLVQLASGERPTTSPSDCPPRSDTRLVSAFNTPSLTALAPGSDLRERLSALRSDTKDLPIPHLVTFGARNASAWALDAMAQRITAGLLDWPGLRAELIRASQAKRDFEPLLERITPSQLWQLRRILASHHLDEEAEKVLLVAVADRVVAGEKFDSSAMSALLVTLIGAGHDEHVRQLLRIYTADSYLRHALTVELEHPRFGGSHEQLLARFNQVYRRFGLEPVALTGNGSTPFTRLRAEPVERIEDGPLVTVIMSCWSPGEELLLAVRSIVDQSYQNWELIVTDDASPAEHSIVLDEVAGLDPRIRVIRNDLNSGTYVRRNEALLLARGEFVTMQDSDDWSHPRRLEIQARDLIETPGRFANVVRNVRLTTDLSLYSERGMHLGICEPAIMFRREVVLTRIGFFDSIRKAADREFRERLEAATGEPTVEVGPEVPLVLMLADIGSLSGSDFRGGWVHPARIAYRSSMNRLHELISDRQISPVFPEHQEVRRLDAPAALLGRSLAPSNLDLLVILDARMTPARKHFLTAVTEELSAALESGLTVGVMHSDSLRGGKAQGYFDAPLQLLVDEGGLHRVLQDQPIDVDTVVIRHSVAVQGHNPERRTINAKHAVIVEEPNGGDERGTTFAKSDVTDVVRAWFDVEPEWVVAEAWPVPPMLESLRIDESDLHVTVSFSSQSSTASVELSGSGAPPSALHPTPAPGSGTAPSEGEGRLATASFPLRLLGHSPFSIRATIDSHTFALDVGVSQLLPELSAPLLYRLPQSRLQLVDEASGVVGRNDPLHRSWLHATVLAASLVEDRIMLDIAAPTETKLTGVAAVRVVNGVIRRREFGGYEATAEGFRVSRPYADMANNRWQLMGVFQTPQGRVQFPLRFDEAIQTTDDEGWRIRRLGENVVHVVAHSETPAARHGAAAHASPVARQSSLADRLSRALARSKKSL